jgi:hypothetical protein
MLNDLIRGFVRSSLAQAGARAGGSSVAPKADGIRRRFDEASERNVRRLLNDD